MQRLKRVTTEDFVANRRVCDSAFTSLLEENALRMGASKSQIVLALWAAMMLAGTKRAAGRRSLLQYPGCPSARQSNTVCSHVKDWHI